MKVEVWKGDEKVSVNEMIAVLNEALKMDGEALKNLVSARIKCNEKLLKHKTIQVGVYDKNGKSTAEGKGENRVGILGLLNGLVGLDKNLFGPITAKIEDDGSISSFVLTDTKAVSKKLKK